MRLTDNSITAAGSEKHPQGVLLQNRPVHAKIHYGVLFLLTCAVLCLPGCETTRPIVPETPPSTSSYEVDGKTYHRLDSAQGFREEGVASWYGKQFHEKKTANGEVYNMHAMTAAHKTLPFGTMVEVKNTENNRTTIVRVNDRGPFCRDRIIDLSYRAAKEIGMIQKGTAPVEIAAIGTDEAVLTPPGTGEPDNLYFTGDFTIQAGSFGDPYNAERLKIALEKITGNVHIAPFDSNGTTYYRVRVGRFTSVKQAKHVEQHLLQNGFANVYTVAWDL